MVLRQERLADCRITGRSVASVHWITAVAFSWQMCQLVFLGWAMEALPPLGPGRCGLV